MASTWAEIKKAQRTGRKPDGGPADLVKSDRDAGPNIHRDPYTWTVATPEEFRRGSRTTQEKPHLNEMTQAASNAHDDAKYEKGRPVGRKQRYDELQQVLAGKIRNAKTDKEREQAEDDYRMMIDDRYGQRMRRRDMTGGKRR